MARKDETISADNAIAAMRTANNLAGVDRRAEDQLQIGTGVKRAGDTFHRLRQHGGAKQQTGGRDRHQSWQIGADFSRMELRMNI